MKRSKQRKLLVFCTDGFPLRAGVKAVLIAPLVLMFLVLFSCSNNGSSTKAIHDEMNEVPFVQVLGIAQDAGFPQAGCMKPCCSEAWKNRELRRMVTSIGVVDPVIAQAWMIDATPDFREQLRNLEKPVSDQTFTLAGIALTHAHIGHYTGLIHLGREVIGAKKVPVFALPRLGEFLRNNGPWSQLVALENIEIRPLEDGKAEQLSSSIRITPLLVPHRDEFSETAGFVISGPNKSLLFIPDIDKWHLWESDIVEWIQKVDYALLDGTFYENGEIPGRDMSEIPHPFIVESMDKFKSLTPKERSKVHFIHFNHTNPLLLRNSDAQKFVTSSGFNIAEENMRFPL